MCDLSRNARESPPRASPDLARRRHFPSNLPHVADFRRSFLTAPRPLPCPMSERRGKAWWSRYSRSFLPCHPSRHRSSDDRAASASRRRSARRNAGDPPVSRRKPPSRSKAKNSTIRRPKIVPASAVIADARAPSRRLRPADHGRSAVVYLRVMFSRLPSYPIESATETPSHRDKGRKGKGDVLSPLLVSVSAVSLWPYFDSGEQPS